MDWRINMPLRTIAQPTLSNNSEPTTRKNKKQREGEKQQQPGGNKEMAQNTNSPFRGRVTL
jgi:hypothetical protein